MPIYSLKDLKKKSGHEFRQLELPEGVNKKIWIPEMEVCYHRVHFNVKRNFPRSKFDVLDCPNQIMGEHGKGCPICELTEKLWNDWKIIDKKSKKDESLIVEKKKIQDKINMIVSEEIFFNGIDIEDDDKKFQAIRFTRAQGFKILETVEALQKKEKNPIEDIHELIWYYMKSVSAKKKTEYSIQQIDSPELNKIALSLYAELEMLKNRPYEQGGPIDLDKAIIRPRTIAEVKAVLEGGDVEEDVEKNTTSRKAEPTIDIDESESLSLDDLDDKKPDPKKEESESLDMDSLELDDIGDLDEPKAPVLVSIKPETIQANLKNAPWLKALVSFSIKSKWIDDLKDLANNVKAVFKYVKGKGEIQVPETEFSGIPF